MSVPVNKRFGEIAFILFHLFTKLYQADTCLHMYFNTKMFGTTRALQIREVLEKLGCAGCAKKLPITDAHIF